MGELFLGLLPFALAGVGIVLFLGLLNMSRGASPRRSQMLMRWRIVLQFVAVLIVLAAIYFGHS